MHDALSSQASQSPEFIAEAWPDLREQAARVAAGRVSEAIEIILCGCGDSHFAAQGLEQGLATWSARRVRAMPSMAAARYLWPHPLLVPARTLVIGISASGEVARTIEALEQARARGAITLAITCRSPSTLVSAADYALVAPLPELPIGPGLLSYLASLCAGAALGAALAPPEASARLDGLMRAVPDLLAARAEADREQGEAFARMTHECPFGVFVGSGPSLGAAGFAAAKVVEAAGQPYWARDVEEWAHLEYFLDPPRTPTWLLSASGKAASREEEVLAAARAIGRHVQVTRWQGGSDWSPEEQEALAPFGLWAAPSAFASARARLSAQEPFRGFSGGRDRAEGGGASRIRSSERLPARPSSRG